MRHGHRLIELNQASHLETQDVNFWQVHDVFIELLLQPGMRLGVTGVVDKDDVAQELRRGMIKYRMDGAQERREKLLMEDDDDGSRKPLLLLPMLHVLPKVLLALWNASGVVGNARGKGRR